MQNLLNTETKRTKLLAGIITVLALTGCSKSTYENREHFQLDNRALFESIKKEPNKQVGDKNPDGTVVEEQESHVTNFAADETDKVGLKLKPSLEKEALKYNIDPKALSGVRTVPQSASCRYMRKSADAQAAIMASPSASVSSDDDGSGAVTLSLSLVDFHKAKLIRASGDAKCRLSEATKKIEGTLGLALEATRFARAYAKQDYIRRNLGQLSKLQSRATELMNQGSITVQDKNLVSQRIRELKAEMERYQAEANQRRDLPAYETSDFRSRHGALVEATNDLQNISRELRTYDSLDLSINTGYRFKDRFNSTAQVVENEGSYASMTLAVKLGALSPTRARLEEEAAGAKIDALFEETGTIWKSGFSKIAVDRMIVDLRKSEVQLAAAIAETDKTIKSLATADRPEIIRARLTTKIEKIRIGSNLAAIRASIKQLQKNSNDIKALSQ